MQFQNIFFDLPPKASQLVFPQALRHKPRKAQAHAQTRISKISEKISSGRKRVRDIKPVINETKSETLRMFREGKTVPEIATVRDLTASTIENHLASFLALGEVKITDLVPQEKIGVIQKALGKNGYLPLKYLKDTLGDDYSYGEIRAVIEATKQGIIV